MTARWLTMTMTNSWPKDLKDIGQGPRSIHAAHPPILVIICTKYGKNLSSAVGAREQTR